MPYWCTRFERKLILIKVFSQLIIIFSGVKKNVRGNFQEQMWPDLRKPSLSAQEMKSNLLLIIKPTLLHYLKVPST